MLSPKDQHHDERPDRESDYQYPANQSQIRLGRVDAMLAISGILVIIGTILAMSASHKIKIAAVWVFVAAVIIGSIAVGIRLTHEFSEDAPAKTTPEPTPGATERVSCGRSIWSNAFDAISRIASRAAFSGLGVESINSTPAVEVCQPICAICAPRDEVKMLSCSYEHIEGRCLRLEQKQTDANSFTRATYEV
jgi:hypothetical protein